MRVAFGRLVASAIVAALAAACTQKSADEPEQFKNAQAHSFLGPTSDWPLLPGFWADSMQSMRDRAYRLCSEKSDDHSACFDQQDFSLLEAMNIDKDVASVRRLRGISELPLFPAQFEWSIKNTPDAFDAAREQCFDIYRDGEGDARVLGPCMSAAVGRDYFGVVGVP